MTTTQKIRAIVADDSALTRRALCRMLESDPDIEVISTANDGVEAVELAREYKPDVITLDINMPRQDGLSALQEIIYEKICPAIMVSSLTKKSAVSTYEALALGAFDCIAKPNGSSETSSFESVRFDLITKVKAAVHSKNAAPSINSISDILGAHSPSRIDQARDTELEGLNPQATKAVVIGISTGGPTSILQVLPLLPADLDAAVFLVQHMPVNFTSSFTNRLASKSQIQVVEATARQPIRSGFCYVAQGGRHMVPYLRSDGTLTMRCPSQPQSLFIPSVGVTMNAVAKSFGAQNTVAVMMTGIGSDGADAMVELKAQGSHTIAESEETAVVFGMPRAAIERGGTCEVLPNNRIAEAITEQLSNISIPCKTN